MSSVSHGSMFGKDGSFDLSASYDAAVQWIKEKTPTPQKKFLLGTAAAGAVVFITFAGVSLANAVRTTVNPDSSASSISDLEGISCSRFTGLSSNQQQDIIGKLYGAGYRGDGSYFTNQNWNLGASILRGCAAVPSETVGNYIEYMGATSTTAE